MRKGRVPGVLGEDVTFPPTNGRVVGAIGLLLLLLLAGFGIDLHASDDFPLPIVGAALVGAVLIWAALLRPVVRLTRDTLVLRGMFSTTSLPLASVEGLVVRQFLAVRAGGRRYTSPAIGRPRRQIALADRGQRPRGGSALGSIPRVSFMMFSASTSEGAGQDDAATIYEDQIRHAIDRARLHADVRRGTEEAQALAAGIERRPAIVEIVLLVAAVAFLVVSFLL